MSGAFLNEFSTTSCIKRKLYLKKSGLVLPLVSVLVLALTIILACILVSLCVYVSFAIVFSNRCFTLLFSSFLWLTLWWMLNCFVHYSFCLFMVFSWLRFMLYLCAVFAYCFTYSDLSSRFIISLVLLLLYISSACLLVSVSASSNPV